MISVIIPAYKKTDQLIENLRVNIGFLKGCEIIVVNDDPSQSIIPQFKEFTGIRLIENTSNLGFAGAVNVGIKAARGDFIMLLNSDVLMKDNSYLKAVDYFKNPKTFAVGFAQIEQHGEIVGKNKMFWHQGMFHHSKADNLLPGINAWAEGGASLFDKKKMQELTYFDEIFSPFYWEDIDLSYRAWRRGYEIIFAPEVQVEHHHESTIGAFYRKERIKKIAYRNQLLFIWKNITQSDLLLSHIILLPFNMIRMVIKGEFQFILSFIEALAFLGTVNRKAKKETLETDLTDLQVLEKFK